jgi:tetratricopeptide (TPR) repeat protein
MCILCNRATSDSEKVIALGKLADYYYLYNLNRQGDSVLHEQFMVADLSNNSQLILLALFGNAITNVSLITTSEDFDKTIQFIEKGINYAKSQNKFDYIALGYIRLANVLRKRGQNNKSLDAANIAAQYLSNIISDSVKAVIYIELGNCYQATNQSVLASTNYNRAFDIALKVKSVPLQSDIYHCFSEMYSSLGNDDEAKEELKKSLALDKENKYGEGMVRDYFDLARITEEKFYIDKTIELADSLHLYTFILKAKGLMLAYFEVIEKNSDKSLKYLETETDLKQWYLNTGNANYYEAIGSIYYYSNKVDSALHYFKLAEYDFLKNYDQKLSRNIFWEIAQCYEKLNEIPNAIAYYTKVLALCKKMNDAGAIAEISSSLSNLYRQQNDFKQAFVYSKLSIEYKDSLRNLSKGRDLALLDVDRETRKHQEELRQEQQRLKRKRDIQYMAITIAISIIFLCMLVIGMFPVSKLTIKMLGYFFFISLFEFIVLLIDNVFLTSATHGEPLKLWLIKIGLIAMLVPFQHFLEHNLIKFLESRKLLEARTQFSFTKWWKKIKKPLPQSETKLEEDTAVL